MKTLLASCLLLSLPAAADEVVLRNGARFSGVVTRENGRVHVRMEIGEMSFAAADVASVSFGEPPPPEKPAEIPPRTSGIVERLEAEARERERERRIRSEESRLDALMSLEIDRLNLERARLEQASKLELRRQRIDALRPPTVVVVPPEPCAPAPCPPKRFVWPIWGR